MTSITYKSHPVEVVEMYTTPGGTHVVVKALEGQPFVGGNKWPVRTEWAFCMAEDLHLTECTCSPNAVEVCPACRAYLRDLYPDELPY